jgi:hypothetical protein
MAPITAAQLLIELRQACHDSSVVNYVEERIIDIEVLHIRVHLEQPETFINVFYNLATDKTAFALIQTGRRVYGVDNAKGGWHRHPFDDPDSHVPCVPESFSGFLQAVETHFAKQN